MKNCLKSTICVLDAQEKQLVTGGYCVCRCIVGEKTSGDPLITVIIGTFIAATCVGACHQKGWLFGDCR